MIFYDLGAATVIFGALLLALEIGFRMGRTAGRELPGAAGQVGAVQAAVLGLLGLLLAFSFSAAANRFFERQDLIVQEANAIGTAYLRADLLDDLNRAGLRDALKRYAQQRVEVSTRLRYGFTPEDIARVELLHGQIWKVALAGVKARPETMFLVLPPVNDMIDLHSTRAFAILKRLPWILMALLVASSIVAMVVIGYGCGMAKQRRRLLTISLAALVGISLWATMDLDNPRAGLMQLDDAPLRGLKLE